MSITHFSISPRRNTQAQSARDVVQYLTREGVWSEQNSDRVPERDVPYLTRTAETVQARNDLVAMGTRQLPPWAQGNAETFFREAAQWERVGGRYAYVVQMSLPRSLTHTQQMALKDDFLEATMHDKALLWVKHEPLALDGHPNPHLHIMLSARMVDTYPRTAPQTFARFNRNDPVRGGWEKDRFWNERGALRQLRMAFADLTNFHLERAGSEERIDPRRLRDQGIERPSFGKASRGKTFERDVATEQARARAAWEQRKAFKDIGDIRDISREEFVLLVREWTRDYERGAALPRSSREVVEAYETRQAEHRAGERQATIDRLERTITHLERRETEQRALARQLDYWEKRGEPTPAAVAERIAHFGEEMLILPETPDERSSGRAPRVRVWDERRTDEERNAHAQR